MSSFGSFAFGQSKPSADRIRQIDRMIDAMASRNKAPQMVRVSSYDDLAPLVSRDYDWSEQDRVRKAVLVVRADGSDEMWWRLRDHIGDNRYAWTVVFDGDVQSDNVSVGEICSAITGARLYAAVSRHLKVSGRMPSVFYLKVASGKNETKRPSRPLYELQIEACEEAIRQIASIKATESIGGGDYRDPSKDDSHTFTAEEKTQFAKAIREQIKELKRTKKAVVPDQILLRGIDPVRAWEPFDDRSAKEVRSAYGSENSERQRGGK
jgi:hypothetical protein